MPPHCDTMDGPVVIAAKKALDKGNVRLILPWAPKESEGEIRKAFEKTLSARKFGKEAKEVSDLWFFETVVRLHRAGEGAPYTGLKPAGLGEGPVIPLVEKALQKGNDDALVKFLQLAIKEQVHHKFSEATAKKKYSENDVSAARKYVHAYLGLTLFSHHLFKFIKSGGEHGGGEGEKEE